MIVMNNFRAIDFNLSFTKITFLFKGSIQMNWSL